MRDDSGVEAGFEVPVFYDSMISKVSTWARDRRGAIVRMQRALREYQIGGITTVIPALLWVLTQDAFLEGNFDTGFLDRALTARAGRSFSELTDEQVDLAVVTAALFTYLSATDVRYAGDQGAAATPWQRAARLSGLRR